MRYIVKGTEPKELAEWRRKNPDAIWDNFSQSKEHKELKRQLKEEQNGMCCYCEIAINGDGDTHIEHYKPKSKYQSDMFEYQNLFACCQKKDSCGHKKHSDYFSELVSPLSNDCQDRFIYTGLGNIIPKDEKDSYAKDSIDLLGLDCKRLQDRRKTILKILESTDNSYISESLTNSQEWFDGFYTVILYVAQKRNI